MAARRLIEPHADRPQKVTLAGDKGFDTQDFVAELREINVTAHVAQNTHGRRSAIDGRTTRHAGYAISLRMDLSRIYAALIAHLGCLAFESQGAFASQR